MKCRFGANKTNKQTNERTHKYAYEMQCVNQINSNNKYYLEQIKKRVYKCDCAWMA